MEDGNLLRLEGSMCVPTIASNNEDTGFNLIHTKAFKESVFLFLKLFNDFVPLFTWMTKQTLNIFFCVSTSFAL